MVSAKKSDSTKYLPLVEKCEFLDVAQMHGIRRPRVKDIMNCSIIAKLFIQLQCMYMHSFLKNLDFSDLVVM